MVKRPRVFAAVTAALLVAAPVILAFSPALLDAFHPLKISLFLAFSMVPCALLAWRVAHDEGQVPLTAVDLLLAFFLLFALLTVPFSMNPPLAARAALLLPSAAAFYAVCRLAGGAGRRDILDGFVLLSIPVALYALFQVARIDPFFAPPDFFSISRAFSTLGNRNFVAYFLAGAALLSLARIARRGPSGIVYSVLFALLTGTLATLSTRGALLAFAVGALPLLLSGAVARRAGRIVPAVVAAGLLYFMFAGAGLTPQLAERFKELPLDENVAMRLELWRCGLFAFTTRPILGAGFGCFPDAFLAAKEELLRSGKIPGRFRIHATRAHNGFIQVAAELGTVGLLLLSALLLAAWHPLHRPAKRSLFLFFLVGTLYDFPAETAAGGLLFLVLLSAAHGRAIVAPRLGRLERYALTGALLLLPLALLPVAWLTLTTARAERLAEHAFARHDAAAAEAHLQDAVASSVLSDRPRFRLANLLLDLGRPEQALPLFESMVERRRDPAVLYNAALALLQLGRYDEAEARLLEALPLTATPHAVLMNLGVAAEQRGNAEGASDLYRRSLAMHPTKEALLNLLGLSRILPTEETVLTLARETGLCNDPATRRALIERYREFGDFARAERVEAMAPAAERAP